MLLSPRQRWPYPKQGTDPWFDAFESMINAMDASAFASREDRHIIVMEGGTVCFTASSGLVTWSAPIEILAAITGMRWIIPTGSISLLDGDILYVNISRAPTQSVTVTALKASQVPSSDGGLLIGIRRGNRVYFRDGKVLQDGECEEIFQTMVGGAPAPPSELSRLTLTSLATTTFAIPQIVGATQLEGPDFDDKLFQATATLTDDEFTAKVELYNLQDSTVVSTLTFSSELFTTLQSGALTVPVGAKTYLIRIYTVGGGGITAYWTGLVPA